MVPTRQGLRPVCLPIYPGPSRSGSLGSLAGLWVSRLALVGRTLEGPATFTLTCDAECEEGTEQGDRVICTREEANADVSKHWKLLMFHQHVRLADQLGVGRLGGHYCGTCAPTLVWHMQVRDNSSQSGWCAWRADRGSYQVASNQAARGREPSTFPKHKPPCIPEPP